MNAKHIISIAIGLLSVAHGYGTLSARQAEAKATMASSDRILRDCEITIRVGGHDIHPSESATAEVMAAVEGSAKSGRLDGLPDDLNPAVLDKGKVSAFLSALSKVPPSTLERLRGSTLYLNDPRLKLYAYSEAAAAALSQGYTLDVMAAVPGELAQAHLEVTIDPKATRARASRAKHAMEEADRAVAGLEKGSPNPDSASLVALSSAKRKRYAAATAWRELIAALAKRHPDDLHLQSELSQSREAASRYIVAPWTGMPQ